MTFRELYETSKNHHNGEECRISDPVIRYDGIEWLLEPAIYDASDTIAECRLEVLDTFFSAVYDSNYVPNEADEEDFLHMISSWP